MDVIYVEINEINFWLPLPIEMINVITEALFDFPLRALILSRFGEGKKD